jgi:hypothetical protein
MSSLGYILAADAVSFNFPSYRRGMKTQMFTDGFLAEPGFQESF